MRDYTKTQMIAMLLELGQDYNEELGKALDKHDREKAMELLELDECIEKLMKDIEKRF